MKNCNVCRTLKSPSDFNVRRASKDGLSYTCSVCATARSRRFKEANPTHHAEWYKANRVHKAKYWTEWYQRNKVQRSQDYAQWEQANHARRIALNAKRVAAKYHATPKWADHAAIRAIYAQAEKLTRDTGIRHEVDHIYPLQGKTVCGLHVEANLQILTKTENIRKHNKVPNQAA